MSIRCTLQSWFARIVVFIILITFAGSFLRLSFTNKWHTYIPPPKVAPARPTNTREKEFVAPDGEHKSDGFSDTTGLDPGNERSSPSGDNPATPSPQPAIETTTEHLDRTSFEPTSHTAEQSQSKSARLPRFYILSGKDHPAINIDLCASLPFSWQTASVEDRIAVSDCVNTYPTMRALGAGCTEAGITREKKKAPAGFDFDQLYSKSVRFKHIGCVSCSHKYGSQQFIARAVSHPSRVLDPKLADVFLVPTSLYGNSRGPYCPKPGEPLVEEPGYVTKYERVTALRTALKDFVKKVNGSEESQFHLVARRFHFFEPDPWHLDNWCVQFTHAAFFDKGFFVHIYRNACMGLELSGRAVDGKRDLAQYIVVSPLSAKPSLFVPGDDFEKWMSSRSLGLFYRYFARPTHRGEHLRPPLMKAKSRMGSVSHSIHLLDKHPPGAFKTEIHKSKFCLLLHTDTQWSHRHIDCFAANSIVVLISDGAYPNFTPYVTQLKYHNFTVMIKEHAFQKDPSILGSTLQELLNDRSRLRSMYESFQIARRAMLLEHPESSVVDYQLRGIAERCLIGDLPVLGHRTAKLS